jgi:hypothetical protein
MESIGPLARAPITEFRGRLSLNDYRRKPVESVTTMESVTTISRAVTAEAV